MNWILSGIKALFGFGTSSAGQSVVSEVTSVVKDYDPGTKDTHDMAVEDDKNAQAATASAQALSFQTHNTGFDVFVDGVWRLMRPTIIIAFLLGLYGVIPVPKPGQVDPLFLAWFDKIMYFLFGGRLILKDIPSALSYILAIRKGG